VGGKKEEEEVAKAAGCAVSIAKMGNTVDGQLKEGEEEVGEGRTKNPVGAGAGDMGTAGFADGGQVAAEGVAAGAGKADQLNHNQTAGNLYLGAFDCNFEEGKEGKQSPTSEVIGSPEPKAEVGPVEVGVGQAVEEQMMTAVEQEGMVGKKPCPNCHIRHSFCKPGI